MSTTIARKHKDIPSPSEWTGRQKALVQSVFILLGVSCLAIWGGLLNMLHDLEHLIYPGFTLGDTILATCMTTVVLMTVTWIYLDRVSIRLIYASSVGITISCFLIAICVAWIPGQTGVVCLHMIALLIGFCKGTLYPMSFGLAGVMPVDKGSACAVGLGLAGVYSLTLYLTLTVWGFTVTTYAQLMPLFWVFMTLLSIPSLIAPWLLHYMTHRPWIYGNMGAKVCEKLGLPVIDPHAALDHQAGSRLAGQSPVSKSGGKDLEGSDSQKDTVAAEVPGGGAMKTAEADDVEDPAELARSQAWAALAGIEKIKAIATDCWKPLFSVFWVFFVTLQLYPNVGPLAWEDGRTHSLYMYAAFQGLEYLARTACDMWDWRIGGTKKTGKQAAIEMDGRGSVAPSDEIVTGGFRPLLMFKPWGPNFLLGLVLIRTIFIPIFVFCMMWRDLPFWGDLWFHYILVALCGITLGWGGSLAVYFAPNCLGPDKPKTLRMQAGQAMVFCANFGIWIALWIGKLYFV